MEQKLVIVLSFCLLSVSGTVFPQSERETVIFGSEGSGGASETSPFIVLLRDRQEPVYPEDVLIGALHRKGLYGEDLELLAEKIERFFIENEGVESLVAEEALRAFRRIDASRPRTAKSLQSESDGGVLRSVRTGRFAVRPTGREASAIIRFMYDVKRTGTLFFEYNDGKGWQIIGADFNIFRPAERSDDGQYTWKN